MKNISSLKAIGIFIVVFLVIMGALYFGVKVASPQDVQSAAKSLTEVRNAGFSIEKNESRGNRFRNHLSDWTHSPTRRTGVTYYDVNALQPGDSLPQFTMTLIEIVFPDNDRAYDFVRSFNNSDPGMKNGNTALVNNNVAYVYSWQLRFEELIQR